MNHTPSTYVEPWNTVVIGGGRIWTGHARHHIVSTLPDGLMSNVAELLDKCSDRFIRAGEGTLLVPHLPLTEWGNDPRPREDQMRDLIHAVRAAGWRVSDAAITHRSGWITCAREDSAAVHVGVLPFLADDELIDPAWPITDIGRQLVTYAAAMGAVYRSTPGVTGVAYIKHWHESKAPRRGASKADVPRWLWDDVPDTFTSTPADIVWERPLTGDERRMAFVHCYDTTKQYLAALAQAYLSWGAPQPAGAERFDPQRHGLWLIVARPHQHLHAGGVPVLNPNRVLPNGTAWVTTPILSYLADEYRCAPEIIDAYLSPPLRAMWGGGELDDPGGLPGAGRWLRLIAERWRDGIVQHGRPIGHDGYCRCAPCRLANTLKATPNEAIGMMAAKTSGLRRMDVAATVRDLARVNFHRKIRLAVQAGYRPVRVYHDAAYYVTNNPDPAAGPGGALGAVDGTARIGRFRIDKRKTVTVAEYMAERAAAKAKSRARR